MTLEEHLQNALKKGDIGLFDTVDGGPWIGFTPGHPEICLDGDFDIADLEEIIALMKRHSGA